MRNTIIISILLFVAVVGASIYYFSSLNDDDKNGSKALSFIPDDTFLITSFKNDETTDNIFRDFEVFDAVLGFEGKAKLDHLKKDLLRNRVLNEYTAESDILLSFHDTNDSLAFLACVDLPQKIDEAKFAEIISVLDTSYAVSMRDTLNNRIFHLEKRNTDSTHTNSTYYVGVQRSIIFLTDNESLLHKVFDKKTPKLDKEQIASFVEKTNKNVPLSFYFVNSNLQRITKHFLRNKPGDFLSQLTGAKGLTTLNINYKNDALMLTGESEISDTDSSYIALFGNQTRTAQKLNQYFPTNTAIYLEYSLSDLGVFQTDVDLYLSRKDAYKKIQKQIETLSKDDKDFLPNLRKSLGNHFAIAELSNQNYLAFLSLSDSAAFDTLLSDYASDTGDSIYRFDNSNLLYRLYGDAFEPFQRPYFSRVNDVLVISNEKSTINSYLRDWNAKNLLVGTIAYKNFQRLQGNDANVTFFLNNKNGARTVTNKLKSDYAKKFRSKDQYGYQDFYSWSAQLSGNNGDFITSIYAIYKSSNTLGVTPEWTYQFDHRLITRPYVFNHSDTSQFILVQEQDHTIHAIHPSGKKIWSAVFHGRVVGDIQQLTDRSLVLVTDRRRLYRFDTEGKSLPNFSLLMPEEPTGTPHIFDIEGLEVIFIPTKNRLLAYSTDGESYGDWENTTFDGELIEGIYNIDSKIVLGTTYGRIYFLDSNGQKLREIDIPGDVDFKDALGYKKIGDDYVFFAIGKTNEIYRVYDQDSIKIINALDSASSQKFYFKNISGQADDEMIVIRENHLSVYELNEGINRIFDHSFTKEPESDPIFFPLSSTQYRMGLGSRNTGLIYLFSENGNIENGFPVEGLPLFYYGKINYNSGNYLLTTRADRKLYAYKH